MSYIQTDTSPFGILLTDSSDSNYLTSPHFSSSSVDWVDISGSHDVTLTTPSTCYFEGGMSWDATGQAGGVGFFGFTFYKSANNATTAIYSHLHSRHMRAGFYGAGAGTYLWGGDDVAYCIGQSPTFYRLFYSGSWPWTEKNTDRCSCLIRRLA